MWTPSIFEQSCVRPQSKHQAISIMIMMTCQVAIFYHICKSCAFLLSSQILRYLRFISIAPSAYTSDQVISWFGQISDMLNFTPSDQTLPSSLIHIRTQMKSWSVAIIWTVEQKFMQRNAKGGLDSTKVNQAQKNCQSFNKRGISAHIYTNCDQFQTVYKPRGYH